MRPSLSRCRSLFGVALLACAALAPAFAAQPHALKPFTATYRTSYMGLQGTGTMTLAPLDGDRWRYSLDIDSAIEADATFSQLLGKDPAERYKLIMDQGGDVDDLDV